MKQPLIVSDEVHGSPGWSSKKTRLQLIVKFSLRSGLDKRKEKGEKRAEKGKSIEGHLKELAKAGMC